MSVTTIIENKTIGNANIKLASRNIKGSIIYIVQVRYDSIVFFSKRAKSEEVARKIYAEKLESIILYRS